MRIFNINSLLWLQNWWTLAKQLDEKLDGNLAMVLSIVLNKF